MLEVGKKAPAFQASAHNGETVRLADYKGRTLVLWFYPRAGTSG